MFTSHSSLEIFIITLIISNFQGGCLTDYTNIKVTSNEGDFSLHSTIEELFGSHMCIEEPEDNFFTQYVPHESYSESTQEVVKKRNYRDEINKLVHYYSLEHTYNLDNEEGPPNEKVFQISLVLGDETYYGTGKSKKEAREMAAKQAIENTHYEKPPEKLKDKNSYDKNSPPTVVLNNLGAKHGYVIDYFLYDPMISRRIINLKTFKDSQISNSSFWKEVAHLDQPPKGPFNIEVTVQGTSFYGKSHTIQTAKHNAALKAIETLKDQGLDKSSICTKKGLEIECKEAKNKLKSPISLIYEYAQVDRLNVEFNELGRSGPPHKPIFEFECILGSTSVKAEGRSKKEAKKNAAQKMLENLENVEMDSQIKNNESQKNKKKPAKSTFDVAKDTINKVLNFFDTNNDEEKQESNENDDNINKPKKRKGKKQKHSDRWSPKEKLLEVGKSLNMGIQFRSIKREESGFYSLLNLNLNPKYICYGVGANTEISREYASLNALKFLSKMDLLENIDVKDLEMERFSFDNYIWLAQDYSPKE